MLHIVSDEGTILQMDTLNTSVHLERTNEEHTYYVVVFAVNAAGKGTITVAGNW